MSKLDHLSLGPGLSVSTFFNAISDEQLRTFLAPQTLRILDPIFGGNLQGDALRRVAQSIVDFPSMLGDPIGRQIIFKAFPDSKKPEFVARVGRAPEPGDAKNWTTNELQNALEFFGISQSFTVPEPITAIEEISPKYGLFVHQRVAVTKLQEALGSGSRRALLHFPTGVGKTRTAMHVVSNVLRNNDPGVVVWLASGKELLEQAAESFKEAWIHLGTRPVKIGLMWGDLTPDLTEFRDGLLIVGLAKGWAARSGSDDSWAAEISDRIRLVVFDEAHQSIASTYRRLTDELTLNFRCSLLGLSATPGRTWADIDEDGRLAEYFDHVKIGLETPADNPITYLIENGYLAKPTFKTLLSKPGPQLSDQDIKRISEDLDVPEDLLTKLTVSAQYVTAVIQAISKLIQDGHTRILVFAATVEHARFITAILAAKEVKTALVVADTPKNMRDRAIRQFKTDDSEPRVLVNYGVLTTGFDAPKASAVVIARPTNSLVLYSQMVGRAIRGPRAGGTSTCCIVTVVNPELAGFGDIAEAFLNWEDVWT